MHIAGISRGRLSFAAFAAYGAALFGRMIPKSGYRYSDKIMCKWTVGEAVMARISAVVLFCALALAVGLPLTPAAAQQGATPAAAAPPQPPYGPPLTLEQAKRVMAAAELEAAKNSWSVAITILDSGGNMVMFHKGDNTQLSGISTSAGKARTALDFKLPSKALDDAIAAGGAGMRLLALKDITPLQGGLLILVDGKIAGAIGVSGALSAQDDQIAKAGADVLAKGM
jgi:uncharacterized protein GlcG (DUF336 family)